MEAFHECLVSGSCGSPVEVLGRLSDGEVEELAVALDGHVNRAHVWLVHVVDELDRRRIPRLDHGLSTSQWVARFLGTTKVRAGRLTRAARGLVHLPSVVKRALAGEVSPESLGVLVSAQSKHPDEFPLHEEVFAVSASELSPRDLRRAVQYWEQQVDHAGAVHDAETRRGRRRLFLHRTFDGMWRHDGDYDPESGHVINAALTAHVDPTNLDPSDTRTRPQKMVDAMVDVCRFWLDHNIDVVTSGGAKPHVTVTVDYRHLTGDTTTLPDIDGTPVTTETIRRLACDAGIVRIVTDGASRPLDVGRKVRTVTPAIRRALDLRDGGCRWDGCDAPAGWTDAHHLIHWADGGDTSLDNMILLCRRHHTTIHDGNTRGLQRPPPNP